MQVLAEMCAFDRTAANPMTRVAYYGGSFDPVHNGHLAIARELLAKFELDAFVFVPAFHAPHKVRLRPTSAYDRYAMLCLATKDEPRVTVSRLEIEVPERPYSIETLRHLVAAFPDNEIFFVMGADSWMDITTWREWKSVLTIVNHIVVTRPGIDVSFGHVTNDIRSTIVDLRNHNHGSAHKPQTTEASKIYITDAVSLDISATLIRRKIRENDISWQTEVPPEVAKYIEKYQIYS